MSEERRKKDGSVLLSVDDLCMYFDAKGRRVKASEHITFQIRAGETYGLVGESGSGKSTIGKCIIGLNRATSGSITFNGEELTGIKNRREYNAKMKDIQMIFQDPMSSLNPKHTVGEIIREALVIQKLGKNREEQEEIVAEILKKVGIPVEYRNRYPKDFSGGQRQRIGIARALVVNPKLIIADECIAALDASVQAQIVNMLRNIKEETGTSFLFISHDLTMVRYLSDRIGVLHLGYLLEEGEPEELFTNPVHPYTRSLLAAIPRMNPVIQPDRVDPYDYGTSGIDYALGTWHLLSDTHRVRCTDAELSLWTDGDASATKQALYDEDEPSDNEKNFVYEKNANNGEGIDKREDTGNDDDIDEDPEEEEFRAEDAPESHIAGNKPSVLTRLRKERT
jgi:oligopeptide transport system ATP-binding protein